MKTQSTPAAVATVEIWAPIIGVAKCLHCSMEALHKWGKGKGKGESNPPKFGYRQIGPKRFEVLLHETLSFYTTKYPKISIDYEALDILIKQNNPDSLKSTA